jgi:hypothetical protein
MLKKCPTCGEPIEATLKVYLSDVVIDDDGTIKSFGDASASHLGAELSLYCENDHEVEIADAVENWPSTVTLNGVEYAT